MNTSRAWSRRQRERERQRTWSRREREREREREHYTRRHPSFQAERERERERENTRLAGIRHFMSKFAHTCVRFVHSEHLVLVLQGCVHKIGETEVNIFEIPILQQTEQVEDLETGLATVSLTCALFKDVVPALSIRPRGQFTAYLRFDMLHVLDSPHERALGDHIPEKTRVWHLVRR